MSGTKPGWYSDPAGGNLLRWFDGERWTEQTKPRPSATDAALGDGVTVVDDAVAPALASRPAAPAPVPASPAPSTGSSDWQGWDTSAASIDESIIFDDSASGFSKVAGRDSSFKTPLLIGVAVVALIAGSGLAFTLLRGSEPAAPVTAEPTVTASSAPTEPQPSTPTEPQPSTPTTRPPTPSAPQPSASATVPATVVDPIAAEAALSVYADWLETNSTAGVPPAETIFGDTVSNGILPPLDPPWSLRYIPRDASFCLSASAPTDPLTVVTWDSAAGGRQTTPYECAS